MLAVSLTRSGLEIIDIPRPRIEAPGDAILLVTTTVIGPWEISQAEQPVGDTAPGTQFAGTVVETGSAVAQVALDDVVVARGVTARPDGGLERFGEGLLAGGHAEYVRVPNADATLVKTTPAAEERAVFAGGEAALGVMAAERAMRAAGDGPVAVVGCGADGLTAIAWLRRARGRKSLVYAVGETAARVAAAKSMGATVLRLDELGSHSIAAIVAGPGTARPFSPPLSPSRESGTELPPAGVPIFATIPEGADNDEEWPTLADVERVERAIRLRQIDLTPLVSTVVPLDEAAEGYRVAREQPPGTRSVLLKP